MYAVKGNNTSVMIRSRLDNEEEGMIYTNGSVCLSYSSFRQYAVLEEGLSITSYQGDEGWMTQHHLSDEKDIRHGDWGSIALPRGPILWSVH